MERGTDREREALADQWQSMEESRVATNRLLQGLLAASTGLVLTLLAAAREACGFTVGGATRDCSAVGTMPTSALLGLLGVLALAYGAWTCYTVWRG